MNAYELADKLWTNYIDSNVCSHEFALSSGCKHSDCEEQAKYDAATMLRQQADRIAELEKENQKLTKDVHNLLFALNKESKVTGGGK